MFIITIIFYNWGNIIENNGDPKMLEQCNGEYCILFNMNPCKCDEVIIFSGIIPLGLRNKIFSCVAYFFYICVRAITKSNESSRWSVIMKWCVHRQVWWKTETSIRFLLLNSKKFLSQFTSEKLCFCPAILMPLATFMFKSNAN